MKMVTNLMKKSKKMKISINLIKYFQKDLNAMIINEKYLE